MDRKKLTIALTGNPNSGKTTIFNNLTGACQHVGNYPGVTVERKEGRLKFKDYEIKVIDLPGTYSLTAYSPDEVVARNVIIEEKPNLVVNIVDGTNLERNLYLTMQLKELDIPMVLAVNMADMAEANGQRIDYPLLAELLGMPVVRTIGTRNEGTDELLTKVIDVTEKGLVRTNKQVNYAVEVEDAISRLKGFLPEAKGNGIQMAAGAESISTSDINYPARWLAIKLLEADSEIIKKVKTMPYGGPLLKEAALCREDIRGKLGEDSELAIVDGRYAYIRGATREAISINKIDRVSLTEKIDCVLLNRVLGIPIFLGTMWLLFQLTFTLGAPIMEWIEAGFGVLGEWVGANLNDGLLKSLVVDGMIGGVGGVIVFMPNILLLFLGIAFLEGTGYMARAAFVMDEVMHKVGLHGKSFVPMLIGFGCTVPAVMATRTLENPKDRLVTMLVTPLMSCGARLPIYTLLIGAFFAPQVAGNILFSLYLIGIILALIMAKVFRTWLLPGESEPFVMELPSYRLPTIKAILLHMWERTWLYLKKAGTIILAASIVMWALFTFPMVDQYGNEFSGSEQQVEQSYAGRIGHAIEPVLSPIGFDWKTGTALMAGLAAKEIVVATMGTLYSIEDEEALEEKETATVKTFAERAREQSGYTPFTAYILMLFCLIYVPCLATIAVIKRETNGWKWPLFTIGYTVLLAWVVCFIVYQGGVLLGFQV
ncbi:MAG: ferrous iron transport protein B [Syntrophomonadaceae bacterium]|nr:ferrous iron transport protein B [Syntrophomonadaceae bacterium]